MEPQDLDRLYNIIAEQMEKLRVNVPHGNTESIYTEISTAAHLKIEANELKTSATSIQEFLTEYNGCDIKIHHVLRNSGRYDFLDYVRFTAYTYETVEKVYEYHVKAMLKEIVAKQLGLGRHQSPDCNIMKLFKAGKITWEDAVKLHHDDCLL